MLPSTSLEYRVGFVDRKNGVQVSTENFERKLRTERHTITIVEMPFHNMHIITHASQSQASL